MKKVLITGSNGFIGKNLMVRLKNIQGIEPYGFDIGSDYGYLISIIQDVDFVVHLAGINRPENVNEFLTGNRDFTSFIIDSLVNSKNMVPVILSSSIQADSNNPYGNSKLAAELVVKEYFNRGGSGYIYRLSNVFGKWCRPNYNSVVATFCHNVANGIEIMISDRNNEVELIHIDDVVDDFIDAILGKKIPENDLIYRINPVYKVKLGYLADMILSFKTGMKSCIIPDFSDPFIKKLHSTFLSYVPIDEANYFLEKKVDERGYIFELIKSTAMGQVFVSRTKKGITRGNHFHHLKNEKFCVIEGKAEIKFRHIITNETQSFFVNGDNPEVVNILPGYTHSITNLGDGELITLFWANEPFDPNKPDTYFENV